MAASTRLTSKATALALLAAVAASGCGMSDNHFERFELADRSNVAERYPVRAELQRAHIDISGFRGYGPESSTAYFDTLRFVRAFTQEGRGPLFVSTPTRGAQADITMVRRVIRATGLHAGQVRYRTRHDGVAAVTLAYDRVAAVGPEDCYDQSPLAERRPIGEIGNGFGCAAQKNLTAMIADPADLAVPAAETDRGSERRSALHKDYKEIVRKQ